MEAANLAQAVLDTAGDAIVALDHGGIVRFWNPGAQRIFGFAAEEAIGRPLDFIIPEPMRQRHNAGFERAMQTGNSRYGASELLSVPAVKKGGIRVSIEFTINFIHDDAGSISGIVAIMRDVTERFDELRLLRNKLVALETRS